MYEAIDRYVFSLIEQSTPERTVWNIERVREGVPTNWNYIDGCMLTALLMLGFQIWLAIDFFSYNDQMTFSISAIFPIAGAILDAMASRSALVDGVTVTAYKALSKKKKKK